MRTLNRNGRLWKLLTLAIVAVPWFMRDQLASSMEEHTLEAQQVQVALQSAHQTAQQEKQQRQVSEQLSHIEILTMKIAKDASVAETEAAKEGLITKFIQDEGAALLKNVDTFDELLSGIEAKPVGISKATATELAGVLKWMGIDPATKQSVTKQDLTTASAKVREVATMTANYDPSKSKEPPNKDTFDDASAAMGVAFDFLYDSAENERKSSTSWANTFRFVAWIFTALGALMFGGLTKFLGGDGEQGEEESESTS